MSAFSTRAACSEEVSALTYTCHECGDISSDPIKQGEWQE